VSLSLSVLDQSPVPQGFSPGDALRNTLDLAQLADRLGYRRYWLAEHHGAQSLACASPEVMIGPVAGATTRIRVGTGGIMLPHYSPLKVAETFAMLAGLHPGRIDLGIGRAAGTSPRVAHMLQRDRRQPSPNDFPEQMQELREDLAKMHADVPVWLLGSSEQSAVWADAWGLPYVFADFINPDGAEFARAQAVAVSAICAETDEEAFRLSASIRMLLVNLFRGRTAPVPPVEEAEAFLQNELSHSGGLPLHLLPVGRRIVTGSPATVRRALEAVAAQYGAEEVFVLTVVHDHAARRRSYQLLAREFGLT
jgi:luciferase family oxidoreductase group 1